MDKGSESVDAKKDNSKESGNKMTPGDASRIQSSGAKNPESATHQSGFDVRAQATGAKNTTK